jgi:putative ABC transport system ATP-binding protein
MDQSLIRLEHVTKIYGRGESAVVAVNDVNLSLSGGRFIILMGPSGSGKTTLLTMMGCLLKPTRGRIFIFDTEVTALDERQLPSIRRQYIGFIFQSFNLFPALTALENVQLTLQLKHINGRTARETAIELLSKVGLEKRLHYLPEDLSGGEKQRVAVARALAGDPPIILADEPTGMLDSKTGRLIVALLKEISATDHRLVFMVSHDNRILDMADEILFMEDGKIRWKRDSA